jgi:hypothetical protein
MKLAKAVWDCVPIFKLAQNEFTLEIVGYSFRLVLYGNIVEIIDGLG